MVTKGIIKSIDYNGNTCDVRIPIFENSNVAEEVVLPAIFAMTPGIYNGYKEGDVVLLSFENNSFESPVILGKLYLGAATENNDPRGAINCDTIYSKSPISIPIDTKLTMGDSDEKRVSVEGGLSDYKSLIDIINGLQHQEKSIGSINAKMIDDGESLGARVESLEDDNRQQWSQVILTKDAITQEVHDRIDADKDLSIDFSSAISQTAREINAEVKKKVDTGSLSTTETFGWDLTADNWSVYKKIESGSAASDVLITETIAVKRGVNTYYITDTKNWYDNLYVSIWKDGMEKPFPGTKLTKYTLNEYNQKVFEFIVDTNEYNYLQFNANQETNPRAKSEVVLISELENTNNAWWITNTEDDNHNYTTGQWQNGIPEYEYTSYVTINGKKTPRPTTDLPIGTNNKWAVKEKLGSEYWYWADTGGAYFDRSTDVKKSFIKRILVADKYGLTVNGEIQAEKGYIGAFHLTNWNGSGNSAMYSNGYITDYSQTPTSDGIYLGTDGIKLGQKFAVDTSGELTASKGYIGKFTIGSEHDVNSVKHSGLYSSGYITKYSDDPGNKTGVYVGTDGIKLGKNFSVDTEGNVTAKTLKTIISVSTKYAIGTSATEHPAVDSSDWGDNIVSTTNEKPFLWSKTTTVYTVGDPEIVYAVSANVSVTGTEVKYQNSSTGSTPPSGGTWSVSASPEAGKYTWTRTVVTYSDGHTSTSYAVSYTGTNGVNEEVDTTTTKYKNSTSGTAHPTDAWESWSASPSPETGKYLWSWTKITYKNSANTTDLYNVSYMGSDADVSQVNATYILKKLGIPESETAVTNKGLYYGTIPGTTEKTLFVNASLIQTDGLIVYDSSDTSNRKVLIDAGVTNPYDVKIGNFDVTASTIKAGTLGAASSVFMSNGESAATSIGGSGNLTDWAFAAGQNFGVTQNGQLFAKDANIQGTLDATSGRIGGSLLIGNDGIYAQDDNNDTIYSITKSGIEYIGEGYLRFSNVGLKTEINNGKVTTYISDSAKATGLVFDSNSTGASETTYRVRVDLKPVGSARYDWGWKMSLNGSFRFTLQHKTGNSWVNYNSSSISILALLGLRDSTFGQTESATISFGSNPVVKTIHSGEHGYGGVGDHNWTWSVTFAEKESYKYCFYEDGSYGLSYKMSNEKNRQYQTKVDVYPFLGSTATTYNYGSEQYLTLGYIYIKVIKNATTMSSLSNFLPLTTEQLYLGTSDKRWLSVYAVSFETGSDANIKYDIMPLNSSYDKIFDNLKPTTFKLVNGTGKRTHMGFVAQDVKQAVELAGLTTQDFAAYCDYTEPGLTDDQAKCGLRYDEFIAMNTDQIQKLKNRVEQLEKALKLKQQ